MVVSSVELVVAEVEVGSAEDVLVVSLVTSEAGVLTSEIGSMLLS